MVALVGVDGSARVCVFGDYNRDFSFGSTDVGFANAVSLIARITSDPAVRIGNKTFKIMKVLNIQMAGLG